MSKPISNADEYEEASQRAKQIGSSQAGTPDATEAAELAAAMRKWEESQEALDERAGEAPQS